MNLLLGQKYQMHQTITGLIIQGWLCCVSVPFYAQGIARRVLRACPKYVMDLPPYVCLARCKSRLGTSVICPCLASEDDVQQYSNSATTQKVILFQHCQGKLQKLCVSIVCPTPADNTGLWCTACPECSRLLLKQDSPMLAHTPDSISLREHSIGHRCMSSLQQLLPLPALDLSMTQSLAYHTPGI